LFNKDRAVEECDAIRASLIYRCLAQKFFTIIEARKILYDFF